MLRALLCALCLITSLALCQAQAPSQWDVITVKPHKTGETSNWWRWTSDGLEMTNVPLRSVIANSYRVERWQVFGLPPWAESTRWDIKAKLTDAASAHIETLSREQRLSLMASLLHERFGLVVHNETKIQSVFLMTVDPAGLKFKQSPPPPAGEPEPKFGRTTFLMNDGVAEAKYLTMSDLAGTLSGNLERTVVDKTGLTGEYDLTFRWSPESRANGVDNGTETDALPNMIDAVHEQLGLKMTAAKAPVPTVVVDTITQPEAN